MADAFLFEKKELFFKINQSLTCRICIKVLFINNLNLSIKNLLLHSTLNSAKKFLREAPAAL